MGKKLKAISKVSVALALLGSAVPAVEVAPTAMAAKKSTKKSVKKSTKKVKKAKKSTKKKSTKKRKTRSKNGLGDTSYTNKAASSPPAPPLISTKTFFSSLGSFGNNNI